jgi:multidrug resistance efflux pump
MNDSDATVAGGPRGDADSASPVHRRLERQRSAGDLATQVGLPVAAIALAAFAGWFVWSTRPVEHQPAPPASPPRSPFAATLACSGIVEAQSENIAVGSATPGVVVEVLVKVGDKVEAGAALFRLDDRDLRGELEVRKAAVSQATSDVIRLEAEPRAETIPPLVATVNEAKAAGIAAADSLRRSEELFLQGVITEQDVIGKREADAYARAALQKAEAELALREAGSWNYDRDVSRAAVLKAQADLAKVEIDIDRLTVRSYVAGEVLQVNVRPGEFVGAPPGQPLVVLGDVDRLHVRVDIDEFEIGRFDSAAAARAVPRGSAGDEYTLAFLRVEPFVVPKKSLTGDNSERVDTRVLQVIYGCSPARDGAAVAGKRLFVGQQVDVFIEVGDGIKATGKGGEGSPTGKSGGGRAGR